MERLEAEAQHVGAGGKHSRSEAHSELRARRRPPAAGQEARTRALARGARAQRLRGAPPATRQAQSRGAVPRVGQDRSHDHHEPTRLQASRLFQGERWPHRARTTRGTTTAAGRAAWWCRRSRLTRR